MGHAARAGTATPWWCGESGLAVAENLADDALRAWLGDEAPTIVDPWDDGHDIHAAVGSLGANGFGLHDVLGNVRKWCRDRYGYHDAHERAQGDGQALINGCGDCAIRGGSFRTLAAAARVSRRTGRHFIDHRADDLGLRLVLDLPQWERAASR